MTIIYRNPDVGEHKFRTEGYFKGTCKVCGTSFSWGQAHLRVKCEPEISEYKPRKKVLDFDAVMKRHQSSPKEKTDD